MVAPFKAPQISSFRSHFRRPLPSPRPSLGFVSSSSRAAARITERATSRAANSRCVVTSDTTERPRVTGSLKLARRIVSILQKIVGNIFVIHTFTADTCVVEMRHGFNKIATSCSVFRLLFYENVGKCECIICRANYYKRIQNQIWTRKKNLKRSAVPPLWWLNTLIFACSLLWGPSPLLHC